MKDQKSILTLFLWQSKYDRDKIANLSLELKQKWLVGFSKQQKLSKFWKFPFTETFVFAKIVRIENCLFSRHFHEYMKFFYLNSSSTFYPAGGGFL
jgi:hypothetical protein